MTGSGAGGHFYSLEIRIAKSTTSKCDYAEVRVGCRLAKPGLACSCLEMEAKRS